MTVRDYDDDTRNQRLLLNIIARSQTLYFAWQGEKYISWRDKLWEHYHDELREHYHTALDELWEIISNELRNIAYAWISKGIKEDIDVLTMSMFFYIVKLLPNLGIDQNNTLSQLLFIADQGMQRIYGDNNASDIEHQHDLHTSKSEQKRLVTLRLEGNIQQFDFERSEELVSSISTFLDVDQDQVRIVRIAPGSIIVTIELPEEAASKLLSMFIQNHHMFELLKIINLNYQEGLVNASDSQPRVSSAASEVSFELERSKSSELIGYVLEDIEDVEQEVNHQAALKKEQVRRLHVLELERAREGTSARPQIITEIENTRREIVNGEQKIKILKNWLRINSK